MNCFHRNCVHRIIRRNTDWHQYQLSTTPPTFFLNPIVVRPSSRWRREISVQQLECFDFDFSSFCNQVLFTFLNRLLWYPLERNTWWTAVLVHRHHTIGGIQWNCYRCLHSVLLALGRVFYIIVRSRQAAFLMQH